MHPPDTMLQTQKYQLRISSIPQSICPPVPTDIGDCLSQGAGPCTWPCSASWGSPGCTFPACPGPHRDKCETLNNTLLFLNKFLLQAFVKKRKIGLAEVFLKFCSSLVFQHQVQLPAQAQNFKVAQNYCQLDKTRILFVWCSFFLLLYPISWGLNRGGFGISCQESHSCWTQRLGFQDKLGLYCRIEQSTGTIHLFLLLKMSRWRTNIDF